MRAILAAALAIIAPMCVAKSPDEGRDIPARFEANRVLAVPKTESGETIKFYTDTGGALFVTEQAAQRLRLTTQSIASDTADDKNAPPSMLAMLPKFKPGFEIPLPPDNQGKIRVMPAATVEKFRMKEDGMLGQAWFGGHVWTWDYPGAKLRLQGSKWHPDPKAARVALGFPAENGERANNFARIGIRVDGKPIDMLLDTGATTTLTPDALKAIDDGLPAERATSFIDESIFKGWHTAHPDWRVIEKAEDHTNVAMIAVPDVEIGGSHVGPVWFTWRRDSDFHDFMSSMMDKQVEGAIGGDAFFHFVMTIDYPNAVAYFRCVKDCRKD